MSDQKRKRQNAAGGGGPRGARPGGTSGGKGERGGEHHRSQDESQSGLSDCGQSNKRQNYDQVRQRVREEGRTARNLVTWNVPLEQTGEIGPSLYSGRLRLVAKMALGSVMCASKNLTASTSSNHIDPPPSSHSLPGGADAVRRQRSHSDPRSATPCMSLSSPAYAGKQTEDGGPGSSLVRLRKASDAAARSTASERQACRPRAGPGGAGVALDASPRRPGTRPCTAVIGRLDQGVRREVRAVCGGGPGAPPGQPGVKRDVRARYWAFLFENLERAVDEIYQTCEADESVIECKEVIMMLECYTKDFRSLIDRFQLLEAYEKNTEEGNRPTSLAWEVRKSSPGKALSSAVNAGGVGGFIPSPTVVRSLTFTAEPPSHSASRPAGNSWADKVKGVRQSVTTPISSDGLTPQPIGRAPSPTKPSGRAEGRLASSSNSKLGSGDEKDDSDGWETVQRAGKVKGQRPGSLQELEYRGQSKPQQKRVTSATPRLNGIALGRDWLRGASVPNSDSSEAGQPKVTEFTRSVSAMAVNENATILVCRSSHSLINMTEASSTGTDTSAMQTHMGTRAMDLNGNRLSSSLSLGSAGSNLVLATMPSSSSLKAGNSLEGSDKENLPTAGLTANGIKVERDGSQLRGLDVLGKTGSSSGDCGIDGRLIVARGVVNFDPKVDASTDQACDSLETSPIPETQTNLGAEGQRGSDSDSEEDDTDDLDMDNKLRTMMDAEESLEQLIEQEQAALIESALQAEQGYLLEIARQESERLELTPCEELETSVMTASGEEEGDREADSATSRPESGLNDSQTPADWEAMLKKYDEEAEKRRSTTWGDLMEEAEARTPGRVVQVHEKLSSPSRKRSVTETRKQQEDKQIKAQEQRDKILQDKNDHLRMLTKKVEEIQAWKNELLQQRRVTMERKLQKAEEKRHLQLQMKVRKAHEEETKANEIAFINTLEAQNKRHDIMSKHQESEARLADMQEERQRKHEEKAAKEAAVEERRRALEAERVSRLLEMQERRRQRESEFEMRQQEKEKERLETARAREREREERMNALSKQQHAHILELQKKIQQKQDDTDRRHKEKLEAIQEKAICMSILRHSTEDHNDAPRLVPYERKKFCTVCSVLIPSEVYLLSHLRGVKHQQALTDSNEGLELSKQDIENFNLRHIADAPLERTEPQIVVERERGKALKKRCKKLRLRMTQRGQEYEASLGVKQADSDNKPKLVKVIKELQKFVQSQGTGPWPQNKVCALDKSLGEIKRMLDKTGTGDQAVLRVCGGLAALCRLLEVIGHISPDLPPVVPNKSVVLACNVLLSACNRCYENCHYLLFTNKIGLLIDLLSHQLQLLVPDNAASLLLSSSGSGPGLLKLPHSPIATALTETLAGILNILAPPSVPLASLSFPPANPPSSLAAMTGQRPASKSDSGRNTRSSSAESRHSRGAEGAELGGGQGRESGMDSLGARRGKDSTFGGADALVLRTNDVICYVISIGVLDKLSQYLGNVRGPIDNDPVAAEFLHCTIALLISLVRLTARSSGASLDKQKQKVDDPTQLLVTLRVTQLVGIVSLMYGMLLHGDAPSRGEAPPPPLPQHTVAVATVGFVMMNHIAALNLPLLQAVLGEEGTSLEYRHIASYLLWYCGHCLVSSEQLLHEVILSIGYFTVLNRDNQVIIQSGQAPTVLQQLCALPFQYFSDARLTQVLFPTLISCCYLVQRNRDILEQELSSALLANYLEEKNLELQQHMESGMGGGSNVSTRKAKASNKDREAHMSLAARFPTEVWTQAQLYFSSPSCGSSSDVSTASTTGLAGDTNDAATRGSTTDVCNPALHASRGSTDLPNVVVACDQ